MCEVSLHFQCVFGKSNFRKIIKHENKQIENANQDPSSSIEEIFKMCKKIYKKKLHRKKIEFASLIESRNHLCCAKTVSDHHKQVISRRDLTEQQELQNKFLLTHRRKINQQYEILLQSKKCQFNVQKARINSWISYIKLSQISKYFNHLFAELIMEKIEEEKRHFAFLKVQIVLNRQLAKLGKSLKKRTRVRVYEAAMVTQIMFSSSATGRAQNTLLTFLKTNLQIKLIQNKCFQCISKIRKIQNLWRRNVKLEQIRKLIILKLFYHTINNLIQHNKGKSRKQQMIIRKLQFLPNELIMKTVDRYYTELKKNHLKEISKWREPKIRKNSEHRSTETAVANYYRPTTIQTKLSQKIPRKSSTKQEEYSPIFVYKPSTEVIVSMIQKLILK